MTLRCRSIQTRRVAKAETRCPWAWPCVSARRISQAGGDEGRGTGAMCVGGVSSVVDSLLEVALLRAAQLGRTRREDVIGGRDDRAACQYCPAADPPFPPSLPSRLPLAPPPSPSPSPSPTSAQTGSKWTAVTAHAKLGLVQAQAGTKRIRRDTRRPLTPFPLRPSQPTTPSSARKPASARRVGLRVS